MGHVSSEHLPTIVTAEPGKKGEGPKLEDEALDDDDAPPSDVRKATTVTDEELRAFLVLLPAGHRCANGALGAGGVTLNGVPFNGNAVQIWRVQ